MAVTVAERKLINIVICKYLIAFAMPVSDRNLIKGSNITYWAVSCDLRYSY